MDDEHVEVMDKKQRLIIVSNRLPVVLSKDSDGTLETVPGSGGLVTALAPVLRDRGGLWIGWSGTTDFDDDEVDRALAKTSPKGFDFISVPLEKEEVDHYYFGYSNEIIWPLFHDLAPRCRFEPHYWQSYRDVNRKFARIIKEQIRPHDYIWIHDYHLVHTGMELKDMGVANDVGFFLHIPFPPLDTFIRLPWRFELLQSLLRYDLLGFQTMRDRRNFIHCARSLLRNIQVEGKGQVVRLKSKDHDLRVGAFPISIDFDEFAGKAATRDVADWAWLIHERLPNIQIILGIDRLDYTKGIPERLEAFRNLLTRYPELQEKVVFVQVVVPSRQSINEYSDLKTEIEHLVGEINGQFTRSGWVPIHYMYRSLTRTELVAYYRTAEIALITPIKDGMNLIAKEYCACSLEENCVLILSEFAGAASQMHRGALLVNPHDIESMADAINRAYHMDPEEKRKKMKILRQSIKRQNIFWWVNTFLDAGIAKGLNHFPVMEDYMPKPKMDDRQAQTASEQHQ